MQRNNNWWGVNVCALQETKIENAGVHRVNGSMIITFDSRIKHCGNGFVVPMKWQEWIRKYWRESNRICVFQKFLKLPDSSLWVSLLSNCLFHTGSLQFSIWSIMPFCSFDILSMSGSDIWWSFTFLCLTWVSATHLICPWAFPICSLAVLLRIHCSQFFA